MDSSNASNAVSVQKSKHLQPFFKQYSPLVFTEETTVEKDANTSASPLNSSTFSFDTFGSPVAQKSKPCTSNLQSACRLSLTTHRLYSQELALPEGVEAISVTPSAGEGQ